MLLIIETAGLCLLFWLLCYLGTGTDEKNIKSYRSYPDAVQSMLKADPKLKGMIRETSPAAVFFSNVLLFSVILFFFGLSVKKETFSGNFLNILILGQVLNAFDYFVMDLLWFRNTRRTRFQGTEKEDRLYRDPQNHRKAFLRGIGAFFLVALIDGGLLSLF